MKFVTNVEDEAFKKNLKRIEVNANVLLAAKGIKDMCSLMIEVNDEVANSPGANEVFVEFQGRTISILDRYAQIIINAVTSK